jgi:hypothetical protein
MPNSAWWAKGAARAPGGISVKSVFVVGAVALIAGSVSGCVPVIGAVTLSDLLTGSSLAATALTGKSFSDDALSLATGKDCSVMDAALETDRHICEADGAKATQHDFKGLIGMVRAQPAAPVAAFAGPAAPFKAADATSATPAPPQTTAQLNSAALAAVLASSRATN